MDITEVRVYPVDDEKVKAFVSITLDHCFVVRDLKVIKGASGLFVAMPRRKMRDRSYKDTAHPLNGETRRLIENKVLDEYAHFVQRETKTKRPTAQGQPIGFPWIAGGIGSDGAKWWEGK